MARMESGLSDLAVPALFLVTNCFTSGLAAATLALGVGLALGAGFAFGSGLAFGAGLALGTGLVFGAGLVLVTDLVFGTGLVLVTDLEALGITLPFRGLGDFGLVLPLTDVGLADFLGAAFLAVAEGFGLLLLAEVLETDLDVDFFAGLAMVKVSMEDEGTANYQRVGSYFLSRVNGGGD